MSVSQSEGPVKRHREIDGEKDMERNNKYLLCFFLFLQSCFKPEVDDAVRSEPLTNV